MSLRRLLVGMASLCMTGYLIRVIEIERKQEVNCAAGFDASEPHLGKVSRGAVGMGRAGRGLSPRRLEMCTWRAGGWHVVLHVGCHVTHKLFIRQRRRVPTW